MSKKADPRLSDSRRIKGSGNVFLDLGFDPAEAKIMALRAEVMIRCKASWHYATTCIAADQGQVAGFQPGHASDTCGASGARTNASTSRLTCLSNSDWNLPLFIWPNSSE